MPEVSPAINAPAPIPVAAEIVPSGSSISLAEYLLPYSKLLEMPELLNKEIRTQVLDLFNNNKIKFAEKIKKHTGNLNLEYSSIIIFDKNKEKAYLLIYFHNRNNITDINFFSSKDKSLSGGVLYDFGQSCLFRLAQMFTLEKNELGKYSETLESPIIRARKVSKKYDPLIFHPFLKEVIMIRDHMRNPAGDRVFVCYALQNNKNPMIIMEFFPGKDLASIMIDKIDLTLIERLIIAKCTFLQIGTLLSQNILHRDFKPDNIIVYFNKNSLYAILVDFGCSTTIDVNISDNPEILGTVNYIPKQLFANNDAQSIASELYSIGVTFYHLFESLFKNRGAQDQHLNYLFKLINKMYNYHFTRTHFYLDNDNSLENFNFFKKTFFDAIENCCKYSIPSTELCPTPANQPLNTPE